MRFVCLVENDKRGLCYNFLKPCSKLKGHPILFGLICDMAILIIVFSPQNVNYRNLRNYDIKKGVADVTIYG